ncbi:PD40 domain-containing protein [Candidatus Berkelbacteria bacterium]|nr:PD40 domain-containing protein [Candidatus Berkelbacteria bacterium]
MIEQIYPQQPGDSQNTPKKQLQLSPKTKKILLIAAPIILFALLFYGLFAQGIIGSERNATVSVKVTDSDQAAIENAQVVIGDNFTNTNADGTATVATKAGKRIMVVKKTGYIQKSSEITVKAGANDIGTVTLEDSPDARVDLSISIVDYLSNEEVSLAKITLNDLIPSTTGNNYFFKEVPIGDYELTISANGYETFTSKVVITKTSKELDKVELVPSGKIVFESNREGGKRGIFTASLDGSDQKPLISRVGNTEDYLPTFSPNQQRLYFFSTRDNSKNSQGVLEEYLYVSKIDGSELTKIDKTNFYTTKWSADSSLIGYLKTTSDTPTYGLFIYNVSTKKKVEIKDYKATGEFAFSLNGQRIAFVAEGADGSNALYIANVDGTNIVKVIDGYVYSLEFSSANNLRYTVYDNAVKSYEYNISTKIISTITLSDQDKDLSAVLSPDKKYRAYVSTRDGKTNLFISDASGKNERKLTDINKVQGSILWSLNSSYITFNVVSSDETARYVVAINGAKAKKIVDINFSYNF